MAETRDCSNDNASGSRNNIGTSSTPEKVILPVEFLPGCRDVIIGRGRKIYMHSGNIYFRELVQRKVREYSNSNSRTEKSYIIQSIVNHIQSESPFGRFVKLDPDDQGLWHEVSDELAREKTSQAFRDLLFEKYASSNESKKKARRGKGKTLHQKSRSAPAVLTVNTSMTSSLTCNQQTQEQGLDGASLPREEYCDRIFSLGHPTSVPKGQVQAFNLDLGPASKAIFEVSGTNDSNCSLPSHLFEEEDDFAYHYTSNNSTFPKSSPSNTTTTTSFTKSYAMNDAQSIHLSQGLTRPTNHDFGFFDSEDIDTLINNKRNNVHPQASCNHFIPSSTQTRLSNNNNHFPKQLSVIQSMRPVSRDDIEPLPMKKIASNSTAASAAAGPLSYSLDAEEKQLLKHLSSFFQNDIDCCSSQATSRHSAPTFSSSPPLMSTAKLSARFSADDHNKSAAAAAITSTTRTAAIAASTTNSFLQADIKSYDTTARPTTHMNDNEDSFWRKLVSLEKNDYCCRSETF